jgi:hypothetical protein
MSWSQVTTFKGNRQVMSSAIKPLTVLMYLIKFKKLKLLPAYQVKSWSQVTTFKGNHQVMSSAITPLTVLMYLIKFKKLKLSPVYQVTEV